MRPITQDDSSPLARLTQLPSGGARRYCKSIDAKVAVADGENRRCRVAFAASWICRCHDASVDGLNVGTPTFVARSGLTRIYGSAGIPAVAGVSACFETVTTWDHVVYSETCKWSVCTTRRSVLPLIVMIHHECHNHTFECEMPNHVEVTDAPSAACSALDDGRGSMIVVAKATVCPHAAHVCCASLIGHLFPEFCFASPKCGAMLHLKT